MNRSILLLAALAIGANSFADDESHDGACQRCGAIPLPALRARIMPNGGVAQVPEAVDNSADNSRRLQTY